MIQEHRGTEVLATQKILELPEKLGTKAMLTEGVVAADEAGFIVGIDP